MGESRKNPKFAKDGKIVMSVRLPPDLHARLLARCKKDGMKLNGLIPKLLEFGLTETELVLRRRDAGSEIKDEKKAATSPESRRRAGGQG